MIRNLANLCDERRVIRARAFIGFLAANATIFLITLPLLKLVTMKRIRTYSPAVFACVGRIFYALKLSIFAFLVVGFFCYGSCRKGGKCEEVESLLNSSIEVAFKDKVTGKYLYTETNSLYKIDTLKIIGQNNQSMGLLKNLQQIPNSLDRYWSVNFGNIYNAGTDAGAFSTELCRDFIVKYTYDQADTIKACFKTKNISCGPVFEYLTIYYKNEIVGVVSDRTGIVVTINKK